MSPLDAGPVDALAVGALGAMSASAALALTYAAAQLHLLSLWLRAPAPPRVEAPDPLPVVTVQLPLYNEAAVARRLIHRIAALDWPRDRLEIQVLDDSTDETCAIVAEEVARLRQQGIDAHHVRRSDRSGYKAGALRAGLDQARGEWIAIFDADFLPEPDFLRRVAERLTPDVGLVQARWGHLNRLSSLMTRAQALHLDAHFTMEQHARGAGGLLMGFNGTAGVWRREAIAAGGGWHIDTLTEDLDLAYRAQLAGWRLRYVDAIEAPAELPEPLPAIRAQQHRWMKGGAQVARKLLVPLWRSDQPLRRKVQGTAHLMGGVAFLSVLSISVVAPTLAPLRAATGWMDPWLAAAGLGLQAALVSLIAVYSVTCARREGGAAAGLRRVAVDLPLLLMFCTGISLHNSRAVLQGWRGPTGAFVRTPKTGGGEARYLASRAPGDRWIAAGESLLALWSLAGIAAALACGAWASAGWLGFQAAGFIAVRRG